VYKILKLHCFSGAVICVTLVNRLLGDAVPDDIALLKSWEKYPQEIVAQYIISRTSMS